MRKNSKNNIKLLLILIIVLSFIPYKLIFSKADENVNDNREVLAVIDELAYHYNPKLVLQIC